LLKLNNYKQLHIKFNTVKLSTILKIPNRFKIILMVLLMIISSKNNVIASGGDSISQKVNKIISQLTLNEKISMIHANSKFTTGGVERLGIPEWKMSDGPHGVREEINRYNWKPAGWVTDSATYLPTGTALAATWNTNLAYDFGKVLGSEARARGKDIILGPAINIHRSPLCGRNFEYMSEDPYLISKMVVPYIKGVQEQDVAACVKHFAFNNQEYERFKVNEEIDERTIREIYLPGFKAAVKEGNVLAVMSAYNKFRGHWCSENKYLLTDILKNEWGFKGVVISDWDGTHSTVDAALAGLDIEMGTNVDSYNDYFFADPLKTLVENGTVDVEVINDKVRRILTSMFKSKVFDKNRSHGEFATKNHFKISKKIAEEAVVLLKNKSHILPLNKSTIKSIAVIGENAIIKHGAGGNSSGVKTKYEITPLEGLKNYLSDEIKINYAKGYKSTTAFVSQREIIDTSEQNSDFKLKLRKEAVVAASNSDVVIMFLGLNHYYDVEGLDRKDMFLPYEQDKLVEAVLKVNKNVIVFIIGGSPVDISNWVDEVPVIVQGWYDGSEAGNVFAEILFGDVNPSGKLPFTFPKKLEDSPAYKFGDFPGKGSEVEYKEGVFVGYRYFDSYNVGPQFAFGHGLSYTSFKFSDISLDKKNIRQGEDLKVSVKIKNTGDVIGSEVVQLYIEDCEASVKRPKKELKGFSKVKLVPGEEKTITFNINEKMLSFYDVKSNGWKSEPGKFLIHIGSASDDIKLTAEFELLSALN